MQIYSLFGNIFIELSLLAIAGLFLYFSGWYQSVRAKTVTLQKGVFIYKCYAGETRNLSTYFAKILPDMDDFYEDHNVQVKFPLAAMFHERLPKLA